MTERREIMKEKAPVKEKIFSIYERDRGDNIQLET